MDVQENSFACSLCHTPPHSTAQLNLAQGVEVMHCSCPLKDVKQLPDSNAKPHCFT